MAIIALVFALGAALCPLAAPAHAGEPKKILDSTVEKYRDAAKGWEPVLKGYARRLFLVLCVISLVFTAGWGFLRGNMGIGDFFSEFVKFGITMGIFYWLLENGPTMAKAIIDSMTLMGQRASSTYNVKLTPSDICTQGFGLLYDAVAEFGKSDVSTGIMVIVVALIIAVVFGVIAAQMVVLLCSSWILIYGGVFYLGFGGGNWTSEIAKNYFKTVLAQAMQVFTFCLLIGIGQTEIRTITVGLRTTKSVAVANYWWLFGLGGDATKVVQSETLTLSGMCVCLVFAVILVILVSRVPGLVAGVITGSSITAMAFGGVGGAMNSASGIVTGGAMMASQAAGAGLALASAYKASVSGLSSGGGGDEAESDAGGSDGGDSKGEAGMGGLAGAMSSGLSFAYNMAANLASGAAGAVKDDLQKSTVGGRMSAMIEANQQTQGGDDNQGDDGDGGSGGDSGGDPTGAGGMDGGGDGGGSGGADQSAGSAVGSAFGGADNGGEPDFGAGAISSGDEGSPWGSEWDNAIKNFDPGKVGLPDS
jgi:P-type conjugative transfer protein TrbL